jgi:cell division protein ZipA
MARQAARRFNNFVDRAGGRGDEGGRTADRSAGKKRQGAAENRKSEPPVEELIMISLLATKGEPFVGAGLVEALRSRGLRYGDMNIFHRIDPMTNATLYSVANVVEPGTFDMADLDEFRSPGVCFFMQLPGPENPMDVFEDMLKVAREVAARAGGELKDERRSVLTGQTVEHYRQRISDFCRRRMSMRA